MFNFRTPKVSKIFQFSFPFKISRFLRNQLKNIPRVLWHWKYASNQITEQKRCHFLCHILYSFPLFIYFLPTTINNSYIILKPLPESLSARDSLSWHTKQLWFHRYFMYNFLLLKGVGWHTLWKSRREEGETLAENIKRTTASKWYCKICALNIESEINKTFIHSTDFYLCDSNALVFSRIFHPILWVSVWLFGA